MAQLRKKRRASSWIAAGFVVFALVIVMVVFGGDEWLRPAVPWCMLGVMMIAIGSWNMFSTKRPRIVNMVVTPTVIVALVLALLTTTT